MNRLILITGGVAIACGVALAQHRPKTINDARMEKIARLIHQASWDIANVEARPKAPSTHSVSR